jgi:hypothetical protein
MFRPVHSAVGSVSWQAVRSVLRFWSGSPGAVATYIGLAGQSPSTPNYLVGWRHTATPSRCGVVVTVDDTGPLGSRGAEAEAHVYPKSSFVRPGVKTRGQVMVDVANASDQNTPDNFYVAVVC